MSISTVKSVINGQTYPLGRNHHIDHGRGGYRHGLIYYIIDKERSS